MTTYRQCKRVSVILVLSCTTAWGWADDRICKGAMSQKLIEQDVRVPAGSYCQISHSRVKGNIEVAEDASLHLNQVRINGDVIAKRAQRVEILQSRIDGNIEANQRLVQLKLSESQVKGHISCVKGGRLQGQNNRLSGPVECSKTSS